MDRTTWPLLLVLLVGGFILFKRLRFGSWTGAFLGGTVEQTIGEVQLKSSAAGTSTVRVSVLKSRDEERFIGLTLVQKAPLSASMTPYHLSREQALMLAQLLQQSASSLPPAAARGNS